MKKNFEETVYEIDDLPFTTLHPAGMRILRSSIFFPERWFFISIIKLILHPLARGSF